MKKIILLAVAVILSLNLSASKIDTLKARLIAENFLNERLSLQKNFKSKTIEVQFFNEKKSKTGDELYYIFNFKNADGYIIISANDKIFPVLAYSFESSLNTNDKKPEAFTAWLRSVEKQITEAIHQKLKPEKKVTDAWSYYLNPTLNPSKSIKDISPLLTTTWNQGCGYNSLCPETSTGGSCGHVWAGCVATAMAQVMNYHEYPVSGEGSHSYTHYVYGEQSADFENTVYDWENMPDGNGNAEIAKLMYHCGVAVNMNYSPSGSGSQSSTAATALKTYFKYSSNLLLTSKNSYTDENWAKLMRTEIDEGRPMYYSGYSSNSGHAFNLDGYQGTNYFHINWGWGGSSNGYFYLNSINYSYNQQAIVGMQAGDTYPGLNCSSPVVLTADVPYAGTTTGSANIVNLYGNSYYQETGKEVVHQITTSYPGRIRASITDLNGNNLDVFILSDCNQDSLLAYGDSTAVADNTVPGSYLIVVDGRYAYEGSYTLTVNIPDDKPDLIIENQIVAPNFLQADDIGNISFNIKNIGNTTAGTNITKIYYSDDNVFDGSDVYIDHVNIPELNSNQVFEVSQNITIPASATEGNKYIILVADADNEVNETDENLNIVNALFTVPASGIMDCSSSVGLSDNVWYFGNTETDGQANIDMYSWGMYPDKEVIHSITATNNGVANIKFTEKIPGNLTLLILSTCNENSCINNVSIWNPEDTLAQTSMMVYTGVNYYFIVDGELNVSGNYGLKVKMPGTCPEPNIASWNDTDLCTGQGASLYTDWAYTDIQWYKNNSPVPNQTSSNLWATEAGDYKVEVTENECSAFSETITVHINPEPANADITATGDTSFCEGNGVMLNLNTGAGYTVQWMKNGNPIEGETGLNLFAEETGIYTAEVTNISCSINSNTKTVTANPVTADTGEPARVNANGLVSWFSCDINDNTDLSGNGNDYFYTGWNFAEDRHGNWAHAQYFNGEWDNSITTNSFSNPNTLSLSVWIKTKTNSGGMILGLGDNQWGLSTNSDRMIYMDDSGKLYFGVIDGTAKTVSTSTSYNDDIWHLINATLSASGLKLYVDGQLKAEDAGITNGADFIGWWKIAYDEIDTEFPNVPTSLYYQGVIDEIKIYNRELLPDEILNLFEENKIFSASAEQSNFCETGSTNIVLNNTENFIQYQLRNNTDNSLVGSALTGNANTINLPTGALTETTTFNILATNPFTACSLELNDLFTVNINDLPAVFIGNDTTINTNNTLTLDAGAGFSSYQWSDNSTEQSLTLYGSVLGVGSFDYWVKVEDVNTCENSDTVNVTVEQGSSINNFSYKTILLYPNPSIGLFYITGLAGKNITEIIVSDVNGKIIKKLKNESEPLKIDLQNNPSGIYFIKIMSPKKELYFKILKQH